MWSLLHTARMRLVLLLASVFALPVAAQPFVFQPADGPLDVSAPLYHDADGLVLSPLAPVGFARSSDAGRTWRVDPNPTGPTLRAVVRWDGALWGSSVGTAGGRPQGLVRSFDSGLSWTLAALDGDPIYDLAAGDSLYVRTDEDLLRSADGETWTRLGLMSDAVFLRSLTASGEAVAILRAPTAPMALTTTLYLSGDHGSTFSTYDDVPVLTSLAFHDGVLYGTRDRFGDAPDEAGGLFQFDPAAETFTPVGPPTERAGRLRLQPDGRLTYAADGEVRAAGETDPSVPADAGPLDDAALFAGSALLFAYGDVSIPDGSDALPQRTSGFGAVWSDGGSLVNVGARPATPVWSVTRDADGRFLAGARDVFRFGSVWRPTIAAVPNVRRFVPLWGQPDSLFAVPSQINNGVADFREVVVVGDAAVPAAEVAPDLAAACDGQGALYGIGFDGDRAFVSCTRRPDETHALRTVQRGSGIVATLATQDRLAAFAMAEGGVWAGSEGGDIGEGQVDVSVRFSADGGATWQDRSAGIAGERVSDFAVFDGELFAAGTSGISRWDGAAWVPESEGGYAFTFAEAGGTLFAAGLGTVQRRTAAGLWETTSAGLEGEFVYGLEAGMDADGVWLIAATSGGLRTTRPSLIVGQETTPTAAARLRAWPNPARGAVHIESPAGARLSVFDALGRRVARLEATGGRAQWDARDAAPGVYMIRSAGGEAVRVSVVR